MTRHNGPDWIDEYSIRKTIKKNDDIMEKAKALINKSHYVAGFLFSPDKRFVVLIRKNKPDYLKGYLNGVGGKIEDGESEHDAMVREFAEETGLRIPQWNKFCALKGKNFHVVFFYAYDKDYRKIKSTTSEPVGVYGVDWCPTVLPNVNWLVPMALSMENDKAESFEVAEIYPEGI